MLKQNRKIGILSQEKQAEIVKLLQIWEIPFEFFSVECKQPLGKYQTILILADRYPKISSKTEIEYAQQVLEQCQREGIPAFAEFFPFNGILLSEATKTQHERFVFAGKEKNTFYNKDTIGLSFGDGELLEAHQCHVLKSPITFRSFEGQEKSGVKVVFWFGRMAGVYKADFGIPKSARLGIGKTGSIWLSNTKISDFDNMEFRLKVKWERLWYEIISDLTKAWIQLPAFEKKSIHDSRVFAKKKEHCDLKEQKETWNRTIAQGLDWFEKSGVFPAKRGIKGVYEGFTSQYGPNGEKYLKTDDYLEHICKRADCTADCAFAFSVASQIPKKFHQIELGNNQKDIAEPKLWKATGQNLFDDLFDNWQHYDKARGLERGFFGWFEDYYNMHVYYSDDNGRCALLSMIYGITTGNKKACKRGIAGAIALYKTLGINGHRFSRIDLKDFYKRKFFGKKKGREWFRQHKTRKSEYKSPHYEGWTYAAILYCSLMVENKSMVNLIERGIEGYMAQFPKIDIEHSVGDDFSKLLIACVLLYANTKKATHKQYVKRIVEFFSRYQDKKTGAFPEIDPFGMHARTESGNKKYGTGEAALYTQDTDTISDQLYSGGFIAWSLYLAYSTGDFPESMEILDKLLTYFCVIQLDSPNPQLDGTWTRGFDYLWGEPYGANGDIGWGAYSIETGWCVGPIITALSMRLANLDPFPSLEKDFISKLKRFYDEELAAQKKAEIDWQEKTPKPKPHPSALPKSVRKKIQSQYRKSL